MFKFLPSKLPSRNTVIFISGTSSIASYLAYDRYQSRLIRQQQIERVSVIAQQPMALHEKARSLTVYLSTLSGDDGARYKRAFEWYVKPVWDAAALDYEVLETWDWQKDVREKVHDQYKTSGNQALDVERGDGIVALGRSALKGVVSGTYDHIKEELLKTVVELPEIAPADKGIVKENKHQQEPDTQSRGWFSWPSSKKVETVKVPENAVDNVEEYHVQEPSIIVAPVGFIPYNIPYYWRRILGYFNDRKQVRSVGDAAVTIALGQSFSLADSFPGDILFTVDEKEMRDEDKVTEVDTVKDKVAGEEEEEETPTADKVEKKVELQVLIPEYIVGKIKIYSDKLV